MRRERLSDEVRAVIEHVERDGGVTPIADPAEDTAIKLPRGLYIENLVYLMQDAGHVTYDEESGYVRLNEKPRLTPVEIHADLIASSALAAERRVDPAARTTKTPRGSSYGVSLFF